MKRMLMITAALLASLTASADLTDGLVTWFDFSSLTEEGRVPNLANASCPLTLVSDANIEEDATIGRKVLSFPGHLDQHATFVSPAMTNRTVSFWYERGLTDGPYVEDNNVASPYLLSAWSEMRLHCNKGGNGLSMIGNDNKAIFSNNYLAYRKSWTHYVFTFEETSTEGGNSTVAWNVYVDGYLKFSGETTMAGLQRTSKASTTWIGNWTDGKRPPMFRMGEFRAWTRALSTDEAAAEYARASTDYRGSLVAAWSMDAIASSTVADSSGRGETLTLGSAVTLSDDAVEGKSCLFVNDGDAGQSWGRAQLRANLSDVTYAMWIKPSDNSTATAPRIIDGAGGYVHASASASDFSLTVRVGGADTDKAFVFSGASEPWCATKGAWTHLTVVRKIERQPDGSFTATVRMYSNGVKKGERTGVPVASPFHPDGGKIYFFSNGGSRPIDAWGDEVKVFKGALTDVQVAEVFAGAVAVSAGQSFSTVEASAVLHGWIGANAGSFDRVGYAGEVAWSLVSAPIGGESATIARPENAETEVTLPVVGAYVFRLSSSAAGFVRTSDVTVTRLADRTGTVPAVSATAQTAVTLPLRGWLRATCSDDQANVWWSKKSGPGVVWFGKDGNGTERVSFSAAGTYVLSFNAENAAGAASADVTVEVSAASSETVDLGQNLERHWSFNTNLIYKESVKGTSYLTTFDNTNVKFDTGVRGFGMSVRAPYARLAEATTTSWWTQRGDSNLITAPGYMTVSMWFKYEPEKDGNDASLPFLFRHHQSSMLRLGIPTGNSTIGITDSGKAGLTMAQQGASGTTVGLTCDFEGLPSITGRWVHVAAVYPLVSGTQDGFEIWVDGVKRTLTPYPGFATFPRQARDQRNNFEIGGNYGNATTPYTPYNYGLFSNVVIDKDEGKYRSAAFPGVLDEIRVYSRKLNDAEIRALAQEPVSTENLGPAIDAPVQATVKVMAKETVPLALGVAAFGGRTLACEWEVLAGDETKVVIADRTSASTSVTFRKSGVYQLRLRATDGERTAVSAAITYLSEPNGLMIILR